MLPVNSNGSLLQKYSAALQLLQVASAEASPANTLQSTFWLSLNAVPSVPVSALIAENCPNDGLASNILETVNVSSDAVPESMGNGP